MFRSRVLFELSFIVILVGFQLNIDNYSSGLDRSSRAYSLKSVPCIQVEYFSYGQQVLKRRNYPPDSLGQLQTLSDSYGSYVLLGFQWGPIKQNSQLSTNLYAGASNGKISNGIKIGTLYLSYQSNTLVLKLQSDFENLGDVRVDISSNPRDSVPDTFSCPSWSSKDCILSASSPTKNIQLQFTVSYDVYLIVQGVLYNAQCPISASPCINVGILRDYNAFAYTDFYGGADVEGKLAAGHNVTIPTGYSIGVKVVSKNPDCSIVTVVAGNKLTWRDGWNGGGMVVGDPQSDIIDYLQQRCGVQVNQSYLHFDDIHFQMVALSVYYKNLPSTASYTIDNGILNLKMSGAFLEVVNVKEIDFFNGKVKLVSDFSNHPRGGILFNLPGSASGMHSLSMSGLKNDFVIYNFYEANTLDLSLIQVIGYVIAPYANVNGVGGQVLGGLYCNSFYGAPTFQFNYAGNFTSLCPLTTTTSGSYSSFSSSIVQSSSNTFNPRSSSSYGTSQSSNTVSAYGPLPSQSGFPISSSVSTTIKDPYGPPASQPSSGPLSPVSSSAINTQTPLYSVAQGSSSSSIIVTIYTTDNCKYNSMVKGYNAFFYRDFNPSSDVEGKVLVGGNSVVADGFSLGDKVKDVLCGFASFIVRGKLIWRSGANYFGNIVVGSNDSTVDATILDPKCSVNYNSTFFDFETANTQLQSLSNYLKQITQVSTYSIDFGNLTLSLSGNSIDAFNVDSTFFTSDVKFVSPVLGVKSGSVIVFNIAGKQCGISNMNMESFSSVPVIFNFFEATSLLITGVAVKGSILAPYADINNGSGAIYGYVYANSFSSSIQINLPLVDFNLCNNQSTSSPITPKPVPPVSCIDVGVMSIVAGCFSGDFNPQGSDSEGRICAGGNSVLPNGYSIGEQLSLPAFQCGYTTFIVGGSLSWSSGRNYFGNIVAGSKGTFSDTVLDPSCNLIIKQNQLDFNSTDVKMKSLSIFYKSLQTTASYDISSLSLNLHFNSNQSIQVLNVSSNFFTDLVKFVNDISGIAQGSAIVFNVAGKTSGFSGGNLDNFGPYVVIYNFYEAETLIIDAVSVKGFILAPNAVIKAGTGNIYGSIYAMKYQSSVQLNIPRYKFNLCPYDGTPWNLGASTKSAASVNIPEVLYLTAAVFILLIRFH